MKREGELSVLLPVYCKDSPEYLSKAVDSILSQTYSRFSMKIGVDGPVGSELSNLLAEYEKNPKINVIRFKENRGLAMVLNDLLMSSFDDGCQFIARMDADDISLPDRFEKQVSYLHSHPDIDVVGGAIEEIDASGKSRNKIIVYPESPEKCREFFSRRNPHAHPAVMFRNSFFKKTGTLYRPDYRQNQDTMLWYDGMMKDTRHANIQDVVLKFRFTDSLFKKRRNGLAFAKKQFKDRLMINRGLRYGLKADIFGFLMFLLLISPPAVKKAAYRIFR